jgi:RimJ/RimL family protein N-acetyltransferase
VLTGPAVEPIVTERLVLEPLRVEHAEEMLPVLAAPELYTFIGGTPPTLPDLRARYRRMVAGPPAGRPVGWLNWVLRQRRDQRLTGTVQATIWPETGAGPVITGTAPAPADGDKARRGRGDGTRAEFLRGSLAWVVGADWQGHGIATEAARALVGWLRSHEVTALMATIHPGNTASAMVARRIGLLPTDDLVDDEIVWVSSARR